MRDVTGSPRDQPLVVCIGLPSDEAARLLQVARPGTAFSVVSDLAHAVDLLQLGGVVGESSDDRGLVVGALSIAAASRRVRLGEDDLSLSSREFDLLLELAMNAGRVRPYDVLSASVWRQRYLGDSDRITSAVLRLRKKLPPSAQVAISAVAGVGYRLDPTC